MLGMTESTSPAMSFLLDGLKQNKEATYAELKEAAEQKDLQIYPIMFGRAKAMLGLVKSKKRGTGKAAKASARAAGKRSGSSKSERIRELLQSDMSGTEIAKQVGCTPALVYTVKANAKGKTKVTGAKRRQAKEFDGLDNIITAVRESARETERLRGALQKIQKILVDVV